jgi:protein disulfide-isomerase
MNLCRIIWFPIFLVLAAAVANGADWQTDYEQALATAKTTKKYVLLDFTGSDWCGPCIRMRKEVFSKPAFLNYAKNKLVLVEIDYPRVKTLPENLQKQNDRLMHQYGIDQSGFPTVILLDPDGKNVGQLEGYSGERPADIIAWVEKLRGKSS